jgi:radical SAM protein with 4Fe4S-binding SPASM domain
MLASESKHKKVSFIGGGEPMVTWDVIEWSVNYINQHKSPDDNISYSITTNATLLTEHIIQFCKDNKIHIGVSFEIIKDIQDNQRPFYKSTKSTFNVIHKNIIKLIDNKVSFGIRSTITKLNVALMPEMVNFVADNYSVLKKVHFEQVTDPSQNDSEFYSLFIDSFFQAREIGKSRGLDVYNSITNSVYRIRERFCNGEMCITPTGNIVACHRISSEKDMDYSTFCYGRINEESISLDLSKYQSYYNFANVKRQECGSCFAFWHCAGICPMERTVLKEKQLDAKCNFTKEIVKRVLLEKINDSKI